MDGLQTGRAPSAVRSLAPLRLLKIDRTNSDGHKNGLPTKKKEKKKENEYINLKYGGQKSVQEKNNTRTTNSSQTFKTKKEKNSSNKEVL